MRKIMFADKFGLTDDVLRGRKTMTRRIIKFKDELVLEWSEIPALEERWKKDMLKIYAPFDVGDVVAIAQSYRVIYREMKKDPDNPIYETFKAQDETELRKSAGWRNKMFVKASLMPHHICITDRKIERLQDISSEDCMREGVFQCAEPATATPTYHVDGLYADGLERERILDVFLSPFGAYTALIDRLSGKGTMESNPWAIAYTFELKD